MDLLQINQFDLIMIIPLFLAGSILHFVYNWSKHKKGVAIIGAVNESYWEHLKIAFWPLFIFYLFEYILGGWRYSQFIPAKTVALYVVAIVILALVYGYKNLIKRNVLFLDISIFFIAIFVAQILGTNLLNELVPSNLTIIFSIVFMAFLLLAFIIFTFRPPKDPDLFKDPITKKYGLKGHK